MNALRAFEATARCRSISDASEELFVTPSAVSQQIKKLEESLDIELLRREHRKISLTEEGRRLSTSLTEAFFGISRAIADLTDTKRTECLVIACPPPFAAKFLAPRIGTFIAQNPGLDVRLSVDVNKVDYVASGIDVGIRIGASVDEWMVPSKPFWEHRAPLATERYLTDNNILGHEDLIKATLLEKSFGDLMHDAATWDDWYRAAFSVRPERQRSVDFGTHCDQALDSARAGAGIVLGELITGSIHVMEGELVCPFGPVVGVGSAFRVVHHESMPLSEHASLFTSWVKKELGIATVLIEELKENLEATDTGLHTAVA